MEALARSPGSISRGTMCKETEMKILHGSRMCSGDTRGKKGLEAVMESPEGLKREHCALAPRFHCSSAQPSALCAPQGRGGTHSTPQKLTSAELQRGGPQTALRVSGGRSWAAKEAPEGWGSTAVPGREGLPASCPSSAAQGQQCQGHSHGPSTFFRHGRWGALRVTGMKRS